MTTAIDIIQLEHANLQRVLTALRGATEKLVEAAEAGRKKPNLDPLFSMIYYIRVFPDRLHHPKEEIHLFTPLLRRCPDCADLIGRLRDQHEQGEALIDALETEVKRIDGYYPEGLANLVSAVDSYIAFQLQHMELEETELLPAARAHLAEADWEDVNRAFAGHADPLFGQNLETGFRSLMDWITRAQPPH